MSFMDKLKAGAGQAKELAGQAAGQAKELAGEAAAKARLEARQLQTKRDLNEAYDDLGRAAYELWESGAIVHANLESRARRARGLIEELARIEAEEKEAGEGGAEPSGDAEPSGGAGASETPPDDTPR